MNVKPGNFHKGDEKTLYPHIWGFYFDLTLSDFQQCGLFGFQSYLLIVELKYNLL